MVEVEYLGETKTFSPQEISSMVLMKVTFLWPQLRGIACYISCVTDRSR